MALKSFKFVFIPADRLVALSIRAASARAHVPGLTPRLRSSQPMEELEQELPPGKEVECLTNRLQAHFRCVLRRGWAAAPLVAPRSCAR
jgi:hypothetical protein